jgi:hypothetical protein
MIQVKDGKVVQTLLPQVGVLSDGRTVSGYHVLPADILRAEGWRDEIDIKPELKDGEILVFDSYNIKKDLVEVIYRIEAMPEPVKSETEKLREEMDTLKAVLAQKEILTKAELEPVKVG